MFERHPRLRVVCVEADAGWAPHWMYRADHAYARHRNWLEVGALSRLPSEYFREHVYLTFQDDWVAFRMIDASPDRTGEARAGLADDRLLWANDHPHSDSTWPDSQAMLAEHTAGMDPARRDRIVRGNTCLLYTSPSPRDRS